METILISGKSASGKDTFANIIKDKLEAVGCNVLIIHFADLVKFYAKEYYNWNGVKDEAGRDLLQKLGTNLVREQFPDYWAETIAKFLAVMNHYEEFDCALIPDTRFENEIEVVKFWNPNAISIRIQRFNEDKSDYINPDFTEEQLRHPSEIALDDYCEFDYYVDNIGLKDLEDSADLILKITGLLDEGEKND